METLPGRLARGVRALLVACVAALALAACRSTPEPPDYVQRTPVEKPWTRATVEAHEHLWLETSTGRRGYMTGPLVETDDGGEYLTTKEDRSVHIALSEVLVMDALAQALPELVHTPIEKPWTKAAIESHRHVWVETSDGRKQVLHEPLLATDESGEHLTSGRGAVMRIPLADVVVLDAVEQKGGPSAVGVTQGVAGSVAAAWGAVFLFLPAILLIVLLA